MGSAQVPERSKTSPLMGRAAKDCGHFCNLLNRRWIGLSPLLLPSRLGLCILQFVKCFPRQSVFIFKQDCEMGKKVQLASFSYKELKLEAWGGARILELRCLRLPARFMEPRGTHLPASLAFLDNRTLNLDTDVPGGG